MNPIKRRSVRISCEIDYLIVFNKLNFKVVSKDQRIADQRFFIFYNRPEKFVFGQVVAVDRAFYSPS